MNIKTLGQLLPMLVVGSYAMASPLIADVRDPSASLAKPYVCIMDDLAMEQENDEPIVELAAMQCKTLHVADKTLEAVSISAEAASLYAACISAIPVSVTLQGVSIGVQAIRIIVGDLPCDGDRNPKKIEAQIHQIVCDELNSQGVKCRL